MRRQRRRKGGRGEKDRKGRDKDMWDKRKEGKKEKNRKKEVERKR